MKTDNQCCNDACPHLRKFSRREFIKLAVAASGSGLLAACASEKPMVAPPINPPSTPAGTPSHTAIPKEDNLKDIYIGYCGYDGCPECSRYKSTCDGCLAGPDAKMGPFASTCAVRICNLERKLVNCAYCNEYPCEKLDVLYAGWSGFGDAKPRLDEIHQSLP
jgi:hypothetical protein